MKFLSLKIRKSLWKSENKCTFLPLANQPFKDLSLVELYARLSIQHLFDFCTKKYFVLQSQAHRFKQSLGRYIFNFWKIHSFEPKKLDYFFFVFGSNENFKIWFRDNQDLYKKINLLQTNVFQLDFQKFIEDLFRFLN